MASTYTPLGVELMVTGENAGTWGTKTNNNLTLFEQLTGGYKVQTLNAAGTGANTTALTVVDGNTTGTAQNRVIVLGAGTVGWNAARLASAMDAEVMLLDRSPERLRNLEADRKGRLMSVVSSKGLLERLIPTADLLIGAVLSPGDRAPTLVSEEMVKQMKSNSVIVDVSIDQGGCIATSKETTHTKPTINIHGVQHYAVGNMPGAVPFTSTEALVSVTLPYILGIAGRGLEGAVTERPELLSGLNTIRGSVCHPGVAKALDISPRHPMACLS